MKHFREKLLLSLISFPFFYHLRFSDLLTPRFLLDYYVKESGNREKVVEIGLIFFFSKPFILIDLNWNRIKSSAFHLPLKRFARTFMYFWKATHGLQFTIALLDTRH